MIQITKPQLKAIFDATDKYNPKFELNYAYVDENYIVSTNTRVMTTVRHDHSSVFTTFNYKPFYISRYIMELALKLKGVDTFLLEPGAIVCCSSRDVLFEITIKIKQPSLGKYADYVRILEQNRGSDNTDLFTRPEHIPGILATRKIDINPKYVSKAFNQGKIISSSSEYFIPVRIHDVEQGILSIIMPMSDSFKDLESYINSKENKWHYHIYQKNSTMQ